MSIFLWVMLLLVFNVSQVKGSMFELEEIECEEQEQRRGLFTLQTSEAKNYPLNAWIDNHPITFSDSKYQNILSVIKTYLTTIEPDKIPQVPIKIGDLKTIDNARKAIFKKRKELQLDLANAEEAEHGKKKFREEIWKYTLTFFILSEKFDLPKEMWLAIASVYPNSEDKGLAILENMNGGDANFAIPFAMPDLVTFFWDIPILIKMNNDRTLECSLFLPDNPNDSASKSSSVMLNTLKLTGSLAETLLALRLVSFFKIFCDKNKILTTKQGKNLYSLYCETHHQDTSECARTLWFYEDRAQNQFCRNTANLLKALGLSLDPSSDQYSESRDFNLYACLGCKYFSSMPHNNDQTSGSPFGISEKNEGFPGQ